MILLIFWLTFNLKYFFKNIFLLFIFKLYPTNEFHLRCFLITKKIVADGTLRKKFNLKLKARTFLANSKNRNPIVLHRAVKRSFNKI